ncbi:unnamed protein product, partial [Prorocentrum cordatum]
MLSKVAQNFHPMLGCVAGNVVLARVSGDLVQALAIPRRVSDDSRRDCQSCRSDRRRIAFVLTDAACMCSLYRGGPLVELAQLLFSPPLNPCAHGVLPLELRHAHLVRGLPGQAALREIDDSAIPIGDFSHCGDSVGVIFGFAAPDHAGVQALRERALARCSISLGHIVDMRVAIESSLEASVRFVVRAPGDGEVAELK